MGGVVNMFKLTTKNISRIIVLICAFALVCGISFTLLDNRLRLYNDNILAWSGQGTSSSPYLLSSSSDLTTLASNVNSGNSYQGSYFKLNNNITFTSSSWTPIGTGTSPFSGNFDGQDYTIDFFKGQAVI